MNNEDLLKTYQFARLVNHHQGFNMLYEASKTYNWDLNLSEIARIWTNGCIIRLTLMEEIAEVLKGTNNIMLDEKICDEIKSLKPSALYVVSQCILGGISVPCFSEAVNFLNGYSTDISSANLIQAQRDYFGAHTYQKNSDSSGNFYHTIWK